MYFGPRNTSRVHVVCTSTLGARGARRKGESLDPEALGPLADSGPLGVPWGRGAFWWACGVLVGRGA